MNEIINIDRILPLVRRPSQYLGGWMSPAPLSGGRVRACVVSMTSADTGESYRTKSAVLETLAACADVETGTCFLPEDDFCRLLRQQNIPLFAFEKCIPVKDYDVAVFILNDDRDAAGLESFFEIARLAHDRNNRSLITVGVVMSGGSGNLGRFIDYFVAGDLRPALKNIVNKVTGQAERIQTDGGNAAANDVLPVWNSYNCNSPASKARRDERGAGQAPRVRERSPGPVSRLRVRLSRKGRVRFLSHLEQIEIIRSVILSMNWPVCYSEAGHSRMRASFGPAVSVGYESEAEYFDVELYKRIETMSAISGLRANLPPGFECMSLKNVPVFFPSLEELLNLAIYDIALVDANVPDVKTRMDEFLAQDSICLVKVKGEKKETIDVKPLLRDMTINGDGTMHLVLRFGPKKNFKPERLLQNMFGLDDLQTKLARVVRKALYHEKDNGKLMEP